MDTLLIRGHPRTSTRVRKRIPRPNPAILARPAGASETMAATRRLRAVDSHLITHEVVAEVLNEQVIVETLPKGQLEVRLAAHVSHGP